MSYIKTNAVSWEHLYHNDDEIPEEFTKADALESTWFLRRYVPLTNVPRYEDNFLPLTDNIARTIAKLLG